MDFDDSSSSDDENFLDRLFIPGGASLAPFVASGMDIVDRILELAGVRKGDVVVRGRCSPPARLSMC